MQKKSHLIPVDLKPDFFYTGHSQKTCFSIQKHLRSGAECRALKMLFSKGNNFEL